MWNGSTGSAVVPELRSPKGSRATLPALLAGLAAFSLLWRVLHHGFWSVVVTQTHDSLQWRSALDTGVGWDAAVGGASQEDIWGQCPVKRPGHAVDSVAVIHIPKTAGTLLHEELKQLMPQQGSGRWCSWGDPAEDHDMPPVFANCGGGDPGPDHVKLFEATKRAYLHTCSGFAAHQDVAFFDAVGVDFSRTLTITALRHPVERVVSGYFYSVKVGAPFLEGYRPQNGTDLSGLVRFVEDNPILSNNLMTQHLGGARHCNWPGIAPSPSLEQRLAAAKRNLLRICVIILAEYMDESLIRLARAGGWDSRRVLKLSADLEKAGGRVKATPKPKVPGDVRQVIEQHNKEDLELYQYAVSLFLRRSLVGTER